MNDVLILILSIIGFFALYWVLAGQWKYNRQMNMLDKQEENESKKIVKKIKKGGK